MFLSSNNPFHTKTSRAWDFPNNTLPTPRFPSPLVSSFPLRSPNNNSLPSTGSPIRSMGSSTIHSTASLLSRLWRFISLPQPCNHIPSLKTFSSLNKFHPSKLNPSKLNPSKLKLSHPKRLFTPFNWKKKRNETKRKDTKRNERRRKKKKKKKGKLNEKVFFFFKLVFESIFIKGKVSGWWNIWLNFPFVSFLFHEFLWWLPFPFLFVSWVLMMITVPISFSVSSLDPLSLFSCRILKRGAWTSPRIKRGYGKHQINPDLHEKGARRIKKCCLIHGD